MKRFFRYLRNSSLIVLLLLAIFVLADKTFARKIEPRLVLSISVNATINPAIDDYLKRAIGVAQERNASLLLIELNTPGGLLTSMQSMVEAILNAPLPVAVFVSPGGASATSAGVFITMAGHFAAMAPGTTIGAAHPVQGGGQDVGEDMRAKIENFTVSLAKAVAEQRGRNVQWAEQSVRESVSITDREALEKKVIDFVADDVTALLQQLEGREVIVAGKVRGLNGISLAKVEYLPMTFRQQIANILCDPNIAILIGLAAMLGLGIEFYNPGLIFPGVIGAICLVLSLTAAQVLPINYGGVALLILAVVFIAIELTMPTFGIWGVGGVICLVLGSIYVIDTDLVWSADGFTVDMALVSAVAGFVGVLVLLIGFVLVKDRKRSVVTGKEGLLGQQAEVRKAFEVDARGEHSGRVFVMGELWRAVSNDAQNFQKGDAVVVVAVNGLTLVVDNLKNRGE